MIQDKSLPCLLPQLVPPVHVMKVLLFCHSRPLWHESLPTKPHNIQNLSRNPHRSGATYSRSTRTPVLTTNLRFEIEIAPFHFLPPPSAPKAAVVPPLLPASRRWRVAVEAARRRAR
ncbi:hypothetical protein AAZX31_13G295200 [Glycine max]